MVAKVYRVEWTPGLRSHEKLDSSALSVQNLTSHFPRLTALSELLDQGGVAEIDRTELRKLCMRGT